ncbi:cellulose synthase operon protein YhjQ [Vibrio hyugaensis]|uniref:Cellulose synthase operon protein YhjQ n=1 Tax=Vibrio hyugaensis TaxID=1534743 RepID=A0ABQ5YCA4_9VIBR|nr:cellulose biosynthesis protein BcsQ [Vibrio hyugaensis]GLR07031.1 cellulose synthase operon protein YhjQ [Vibrio hyugaensis]
MKRLLFVSLRGGCGSTTVTANLTQALAKINKQVLAIDVSSENLLRLHFGLPYEEQDGWAGRVLSNDTWVEAGYQSPQGALLLPFGELNAEQKHRFAQSYQYLEALGRSTLQVTDAEKWQLFHGDMSYLMTPEMNAFVESMDMVFVVINADAMNYAALQTAVRNTPEIGHILESGKLRYILNQYQPETEIGRDFMLVFKKELQDLLVPVFMHRDTALTECVANLTTVQHYSPTSQAAKDYQSLAFWCVSTISAATSQG